MRAIAFLVRDGCAELAVLESGDMILRLTTGEVFHFGEEAVTRVAWTDENASRRIFWPLSV